MTPMNRTLGGQKSAQALSNEEKNEKDVRSTSGQRPQPRTKTGQSALTCPISKPTFYHQNPSAHCVTSSESHYAQQIPPRPPKRRKTSDALPSNSHVPSETPTPSAIEAGKVQIPEGVWLAIKEKLQSEETIWSQHGGNGPLAGIPDDVREELEKLLGYKFTDKKGSKPSKASGPTPTLVAHGSS